MRRARAAQSPSVGHLRSPFPGVADLDSPRVRASLEKRWNHGGLQAPLLWAQASAKRTMALQLPTTRGVGCSKGEQSRPRQRRSFLRFLRRAGRRRHPGRRRARRHIGARRRGAGLPAGAGAGQIPGQMARRADRAGSLGRPVRALARTALPVRTALVAASPSRPGRGDSSVLRPVQPAAGAAVRRSGVPTAARACCRTTRCAAGPGAVSAQLGAVAVRSGHGASICGVHARGPRRCQRHVRCTRPEAGTDLRPFYTGRRRHR